MPWLDPATYGVSQLSRKRGQQVLRLSSQHPTPLHIYLVHHCIIHLSRTLWAHISFPLQALSAAHATPMPLRVGKPRFLGLSLMFFLVQQRRM